MIEPVLKDEALLADIAKARGEEDDSFNLWWLGQSGFLLQWRHHHLLFDPYLSDSLTKKYSGTDKPHIRMTARPVAPSALDFIQVVTSSHNHTDHLDLDTLGPLFQVNPKMDLIIPEANRELVVDRLGLAAELPIGLDPGRVVQVDGFIIHAVPAAHETLEKDSFGRSKFLGYVVEFGNYCVYHSGDTLWYEGMTDWLRRWVINVALLPINGRAPERRVAGNLDGKEAATLAKEIGANWVIPCHYEMFTFNTAAPDEFIQTAQSLGQKYRVLKCGERFNSREGNI